MFDNIKDIIVKLIIVVVSGIGYFLYGILNLPFFYFSMSVDLYHFFVMFFWINFAMCFIVFGFVIKVILFCFSSPLDSLKNLFKFVRTGRIFKRYKIAMLKYKDIAAMEKLYMRTINYLRRRKRKIYKRRVTYYWHLWLHRRRTKARFFFWCFFFFLFLSIFFSLSYYINRSIFRFKYTIRIAHTLRLFYFRYLFSYLIGNYPEIKYDDYRDTVRRSFRWFIVEDLLSRLYLCKINIIDNLKRKRDQKLRHHLRNFRISAYSRQVVQESIDKNVEIMNRVYAKYKRIRELYALKKDLSDKVDDISNKKDLSDKVDDISNKKNV